MNTAVDLRHLLLETCRDSLQSEKLKTDCFHVKNRLKPSKRKQLIDKVIKSILEDKVKKYIELQR